MNKIILLTCSYFASCHDANGLCSMNLAEEFVKRGDKVFVISLEDITDPIPQNINNVTIYRIKGHRYVRLVNRINKSNNAFLKCFLLLISCIRSLFVFAFYPNVSPWSSYRILKKMIEIDKYNSVDTIVATYKPYSTIWAALFFKKRSESKTKLVTFHFDLMTVNFKGDIIGFVKTKLCKRALRKELSKVDMILVPESAPKIINAKINYVDFPLYVKDVSRSQSSFEFSDKFINIAYVGSLSTYNRSPYNAIKTLEKAPKVFGKSIRLHIWGIQEDGKCIDVVNQSHIVINHGVVDNNEVASILSKSDFLLNISNDITFQMIPSKIFQYFSIGKPIINFVKSPNDASLPYFIKYGHVLNIEEYNKENNETSGHLKHFIEENLGKKIVVDDSLFIKSTPDYICNLINSLS